MPGMHVPLSPFLRHVAAVNGELTRPVFHAGRISDIATARHAVREGILSMVAMTRAHIADPHIVAKIARGEEERIRPCVGATYCSWMYSCIHNVSVGREAHLPHRIEPAAHRRKVLIIGAGPAGLEAARICGERGHEVELHEAAPAAGGQVLLASRVPARRDLIGIVRWREAELARLGIRIRFNSFADERTIADSGADVVIVATGGVPDTMADAVPGAELADTLWEAIEAPGDLGGDVMIYDGTGQMAAASVGEMLAQQGVRLTFATPDRHLAMETAGVDRPFVVQELYRSGTRMLPDRRLTRVRRNGNRLEAVLTNVYTEAEEIVTCDRLFVEHGTHPVDHLFRACRGRSRNDGVIDPDALVDGRAQDLTVNPAGPYQLYRIGDAVSSRDVHSALLDAMRLCREM